MAIRILASRKILGYLTEPICDSSRNNHEDSLSMDNQPGADPFNSLCWWSPWCANDQGHRPELSLVSDAFSDFCLQSSNHLYYPSVLLKTK